MYWVVQDNIYSEEGHKRLLDALEKLGLQHSLHKCRPFIGTLVPDVTPPPGPVIVMGSYTLARIAQERGWMPGAFLNENFDFQVQVQHWGDEMLNADARVFPFASVPEQIYPFFIRPVHDSKSFTGEVTDWPTFVEWRDRVLKLTPEDGATLTPETLVQICRKKEIYAEFRTWIVDGKCVTASIYKANGHKYARECGYADYPEIPTYAERVAALWSPHRAYVMDIASTPEGLKVIEVNNLNSSGFYCADMQRLAIALETAFGDQP